MLPSSARVKTMVSAKLIRNTIVASFLGAATTGCATKPLSERVHEIAKSAGPCGEATVLEMTPMGGGYAKFGQNGRCVDGQIRDSFAEMDDPRFKAAAATMSAEISPLAKESIIKVANGRGETVNIVRQACDFRVDQKTNSLDYNCLN